MADSAEVRRVELVSGGSQQPLAMRRRRTRRRAQEGGDEEEAPMPSAPVTLNIKKINEVAIAPVGSTGPVPMSNGPSNQAAVAAPAPAAAPVMVTSNTHMPVPVQSVGGATRVILKSKSKRTTKVLLKKKDQVSGAEASQPKAKVARTKTRKIVLHTPVKRLNKTRHAIREGKTIPLEKLRALLIEKKLIKPTSKAPEPILRQIYTDSLIVAKKTL